MSHGTANAILNLVHVCPPGGSTVLHVARSVSFGWLEIMQCLGDGVFYKWLVLDILSLSAVYNTDTTVESGDSDRLCSVNSTLRWGSISRHIHLFIHTRCARVKIAAINIWKIKLLSSIGWAVDGTMWIVRVLWRVFAGHCSSSVVVHYVDCGWRWWLYTPWRLK